MDWVLVQNNHILDLRTGNYTQALYFYFSFHYVVHTSQNHTLSIYISANTQCAIISSIRVVLTIKYEFNANF